MWNQSILLREKQINEPDHIVRPVFLKTNDNNYKKFQMKFKYIIKVRYPLTTTIQFVILCLHRKRNNLRMKEGEEHETVY